MTRTPPSQAPFGLPTAARGVGELEFARSLPEVLVSAFGFVTYLGNAWLCLAAVTLAYVVGSRSGLSRRAAAFALALGLGALGLTLGLKHVFALPRPPLSAEDGFGFPSGHALGTTVFWGGVALSTRYGTRRRRLSVAAAAILLVAASRVVLGVHYLADVVAGVALGVAFLAAMTRLSERPDGGPTAPIFDPTRSGVTAAFVVAFALVATALAVAPSESELLLGAGTAAGAATAWHVLGHRVDATESDRSPSSVVVCGVGVPLLLGSMVAAAELSPVAVLVVAVGAVGGAGLLTLPFAAARLSTQR